VARVGFEFCPPTNTDDLAALAARLEATLTLAERSLRPGWDRPRPHGADGGMSCRSAP
jgi:hypothetical protein